MPSIKQAAGTDKSLCDCTCAGATACFLCVTVTTCASVPISGALVTVKHSGTTVNTCTTDASGQCCIDIEAVGSGSYDIAVTKAGYAISAATVSCTCPGTTNATVFLALVSASTILSVSVAGCSEAQQGATVSLTGAAGSASGTTDSAGWAYFGLPAGTYTWTVSQSRFTTQTGSITLSGGVCGSSDLLNITLVPTSSYACLLGHSCAKPLSTTLYVTDPVIGTITLTSTGGGTGLWQGAASYSLPTTGCGGVPSGTAYDLIYEFPRGGSPFILDMMGLAQKQHTAGAYSYLIETANTITCFPFSASSTRDECNCTAFGGSSFCSYSPADGSYHGLWPGTGSFTCTISE
jgi:hypothetical protein